MRQFHCTFYTLAISFMAPKFNAEVPFDADLGHRSCVIGLITAYMEGFISGAGKTETYI